MKFQTRLMLAFLFATTLVSIAVIQLTSSKVKATYQRQFREKFQGEVAYLLEARERRSESFLALGKNLAESDFVIQQLLKKKDATGTGKDRQEFLSRLPQSPQNFKSIQGKSQGRKGGERPDPKSGQQRQLNRILAVMDTEGKIYYLTSPLEKRSARHKERPRNISIQKQLEDLTQSDSQMIAYFPQKQPNGESVIRDISITPVMDPQTRKVIGAFLMSLSTAETGAERFLDRYHKEVTEGQFKNAIVIEDVLYPSSNPGDLKSKNPQQDIHLHDLETAVVKKISDLPEGQFVANFELPINDVPHYIHFCALNPESPLSTAWQVSAFPMTQLKSDLKDLRIKGSGIGAIGILIGLITAWFLSRNLSIPIRDLSVGTRKIREGQLDIDLPVRSSDEIGELTKSFNQMTAELRQKEQYRSLLGKVSDESVAQAMIEGTLNPHLGGELKTVSVLFCDIRGFTLLTESMPPGEVIEILNLHMTALTHVVREHFGVVDKFVGDEIMAVFGGLKSYGNDAANAARCAVKMIEERDRLNRENATDIQIGIGVATGEIVAGCMGSEDRLNYTVLGAKVNLGARLCGRAGAGEIVIDDETFARIAELQPETEVIEGLLLKGFSAEVPAWKLRHAGVVAATSAQALT